MKFDKIIDLSDMEKEKKYLESTWFSYFRQRKLFFFLHVCLKEQTKKFLKKWREKMKYEYFLFESERRKKYSYLSF